MKMAKGIHDDITKGAYELFEKQGGAHGHDVDDWLEAEKAVMENRVRHSDEIKHAVDVAGKPTASIKDNVKDTYLETIDEELEMTMPSTYSPKWDANESIERGSGQIQHKIRSGSKVFGQP